MIEDMSYRQKCNYFKSNPEWYDYDEDDMPYLTEKAPPEAVESYEFWKKVFEEHERTGVFMN